MIPLMIAIIYGFLGLIIGSFLNVVILRHGARTIGGRSGCLSCGAPLRWYDMVPVVSWLALSGRCRLCGSRISIQYPLVEVSTALLYALIGASQMPLLFTAMALAIAALLVLIATYDILHTIIPNEWSYSFALIALVSSGLFALIHGGGMDLVWLFVAGPLCAVPFVLLWLVSHGRWMGLGDAKLALGIGWLLGLSSGFAALFLAFVIGAVISVCILLPFQYMRARYGITRLGGGRKSFTMKSEVPFAPFLIASCLLVWIMNAYGISLPALFFFS